ncbi:MarR family winged helix-turn-helix transcriptional regulator [Solicola gregarius]|uniref:MarR family transcriptional regulator n=1 Tax=Solicola gregarius TaxID=2908642 RepID=A0AA46TJQ0_9ACTN|nr:MarR family transcriptional regulator [Solicola gregarius]UYM06350.1 MarR family transcriptional regulator [Solicola gregarius]
MATDSVDRILETWAARDPGLHTGPLEVVGRLRLCNAYLERAIIAALRPFGLSLGEFDVLSTLHRHGVDTGIKPTDLAQSALITTGAMTTRLDRLERTGLLRRIPDPKDRRGVHVQLTEHGEQLVERSLHAVLAADDAFLEPLSRPQRESTATALKQLLVRSEPG